MKRILITCSLCFFALGSMSYAAHQESGLVSFPSAVGIGSDSLPAGIYNVHWEPGSGDVQVTLSGNGHKLSVPATLVSGTGPDEVFMHRDANGQVVDGFRVKATGFALKTP
jgi:hypothetical protein